jgi:hypothetical protein
MSVLGRKVYFLISPDLYVIRSSDNISSDDNGLLTKRRYTRVYIIMKIGTTELEKNVFRKLQKQEKERERVHMSMPENIEPHIRHVRENK